MILPVAQTDKGPGNFRFIRHLFILSRFLAAHKFPMTEILKTDVLIVGGGVAGLWLLNRLRNTGYRTWLLERDALGAGQSVASQGMIHGGLKYALGGTDTGASRRVADMPAYWNRCLAGEAEVDLRGCRLLSRDYYMWPRHNLRSRLNAFLGSKALAGRVEALAKADYPDFFKNRIPGPLYRLQDIVLDVPSLLATLAANQAGNLFRIDWDRARFTRDADGAIGGLHIDGGPTIQARQYVFCCGAGAGALMASLDLEIAAMQRRPLRMVMVKHRIESPLFVHCVSDKLTMTPEVTITSHHTGAGEPVWYLGGELAEQGAGQSPDTLVATARTKLADLFPWCDFTQATWSTLAIDRAEMAQPDGTRPDDAAAVSRHNLIVGWPTKLTLAPALADSILALLRDKSIHPGSPEANPAPTFLEPPAVAATPWETL